MGNGFVVVVNDAGLCESNTCEDFGGSAELLSVCFYQLYAILAMHSVSFIVVCIFILHIFLYRWETLSFVFDGLVTALAGECIIFIRF